MVNKAVEQMVCRLHGESVWEKIKDRAGVDVEVFISNQGYPDEVTYRLVGATSEVLNLPVPKVLEAFGEWWVLHTATEGYGELMKAGGRSLSEFLQNLPNFHSRVVMIYPNLKPPRFVVRDLAERSLVLEYHTGRPGLAPFVVGLLQGLGKMFATPVTTTLILDRAAGADHDEFRVEW